VGGVEEEAEDGTSVNLFKTFTLKWWQTGLFKWGLLSLGIAVGAYWPEFFDGYLVVLVIMAAASLAYIAYVWWKQ
jgi:hypothetical protein